MDFDDDIAVVGTGCHFPGGEGLDHFWKVLVEGRNCAMLIPDHRFNTSVWIDPDKSAPGKTQTTKAALIDGLNDFDHKFFGITEAEANIMDPQQKLLLHCTYRALEDAGIPMEKASGTRTGVYIGLMNRDYETMLNNSPSTISHYNATGTAMSIAANRISYTFNFTGPSFAIDSACSSSLVALHTACQAIKQGDCDMAVCGGVNCIIEPRVFVALSKAKMISPDGTSKPFSSRGDGYGRGEGCGIVLLKPLKKALQDIDHVWGIISKTAVNQDGHTVSPITKPSMVQQEQLLRRIYSSETDLSSVQYIEAHGTGTPVGDPVEAGSISNVIAKSRRPGSAPLYMGSVKSNIGHTESAAGVAGLIKVLLMMKHETIVPSVFYSEDSSSIDGNALNLKIPTKAEKWQRVGSAVRVAGLNNFGFGGTNAHAIIKEYVQTQVSSIANLRSRGLFVLSASTAKSLEMCIADTHQRIFTGSFDLSSLLYTSACRRSHMKHKYRKVYVTTSVSDLQSKLKSSLNRQVSPCKSDLKLIFVFCGNGVTYRGMCKQLMKDEPVFREKVREVENYFLNCRSTSIFQKMGDNYDNDDYSKPEVVQPLLFAIQVALVSLLEHWGIRPDVVFGHSVGEVAAAHCSGLLSLQDAVKVIYHRSHLQSKVTGGKMLVVGNIAVSDVMKILPAYTGKVCLAALNSPMSCVLSGNGEAIDSVHQELVTSLQSKNLFLHVLDVPVAYHSHIMDSILDSIEASIGSLVRNELKCELFSTVSGNIYRQGDFTTGKYWAKNIRKPVEFEEALKAAAKDKNNLVFVEIGPRKALQRNIRETLGNDTTVLPSVRPDKDSETMLSVASELFELGVNVNWNHIYKGFEAPPTPIPRYQFDCPKKEVYYEEIRQGNEMQAQSSHSLISQSKHDSKVYKCNLSTDASSYLWDHKNNGRVVIPGALYVELAFASVLASACPKRPLAFLRLSIDFLNILVLTKSSPPLSVLLEPAQDKTNLKILSSTTVHASGTISYENGRGTSEHDMILLDVVWKRCQVVMSSEQVYGLLSQAGFEYGPIFRQLEKVCYGHEFKEAIATVRVPDGLLNQLHEYCLHPVVLDYFLQMTSVVALSANSVRPGFPATIGSVMIFAPLHQDMIMYLRVTKDTSNYFEVCGCFTDTAGHILVELKYVRIRFLGDINTIDSCFFQNELLPITNLVRISCSPRVVVFEDTMGLAKALKSYLHPQSIFISPVELTERSTSLISNLRLQSDQDISDLNSVEILICFGIDNLSHLTTETILEHLVESCDRLREIVLSFKSKGSRAFRVITYRSSERTVDHINPGFVLSGLAKTCAAEMPGISFQLIDLASVSKEDIEALIHVISSSKSSRHLEVIICKGQAHSLAMTRTPIKRVPKSWSPIVDLQCKPFILHTEDPYKMASLIAVASNDSVITVEGKYVEVQLSKICAHSSDYYPVSVTDLKFGQTIYWNKDTAQSHKVLALDFCGSVTSVGKDVSKLKVGDHIASCYPIAASSKVVIPEDVCFRTKKLPILQEVPCVSYITLAWEILRCALPRAKHQQKMCIFSAAPDSGLLKVLMFTASKSGWQVHTEAEFNGSLENACHCPVFVLLPPYNQCKVARVSSVGTTTKLIVVICNSHESLFPTSSILQQNNENVCVHILKVTNIFQRSYLKEQGPHICRWVKMMNLNVMSLSLQGTTFQLRSQTENMAFQPEEPFESYFSAKTISLIVMDNGVPNGKTSNIHLLTKPKQLFTKCGVYIVAGGLSGLGFETLKFIAQRGGGGIVTLSRSAISKERQLEMSNIQRGYGVTVVNLQCDISVSEQVMDAITTIEETFPSCTIKGVFHSAAVLHDGLIETLDRSLFEKVLRPKVSGALNLHFATMSRKVDYFVCYSSISSFIGNASQANYAAANSFLDIFCHYRRNLGLAGQSINWGPLNIGLLFKKDHFQRFLEAKGLMIMEVPEIHEALEHCLMINNPQQVVCKFNISNLRNHVLSQNASLKLRLATLIENEPQNTDLTVSQTEVHSSVHEYVRDLLIDIGNIDTEELRDNTTFSALGIDSMSAMTMQNRIFQERGVNIPLVNLLDPNNTHSTLVTILEQTTIEQNQRCET